MENFKSIDPKSITENAIKLIGEKWMLITAGKAESFNTMTASCNHRLFCGGNRLYTYMYVLRDTLLSLSRNRMNLHFLSFLKSTRRR